MEKIKIRNIPHIEGNFATHISFRLPKGSKIISKYIDEIKKNILKNVNEEFFFEDLNILEEYYHISLCNNVYLKYHQIESFIFKLKTEISNIKSPLLVLSPRVKFFSNEFNTRSFLSLEILKNLQFKKILKSIYQVLESFGLPIFIQEKVNIDI
jgi:hypothetical protein